MLEANEIYIPPAELVLGRSINSRVPAADQLRQRAEVDEILRRLRSQPGVILADEVGMGKTFVALAIAYSVATRSKHGPAIVMVPPNLVEKWAQDVKTFCELYLENRRAVPIAQATLKELTNPAGVRFGVARHSIELMKLLDDSPRYRCHIIFLAQGAMGRRQTDKWVRLALIAEALRRHGRGGASRLIQVKKQIHRFMGELIWALGEERSTSSDVNLWQKLLQSSVDSWKDVYNSMVRDGGRTLTDDPVPKAVSRVLNNVELKPLAKALEAMPLKAVGGAERVSERITAVRGVLRSVEDELWKKLLAQAQWRSPLLVMDEAHHLKNPGSLLARQLQSPELTQDLRTGDGAMANAFDRMLFLTATPFQLGHTELVRVLERFGDVKWNEHELGSRDEFCRRMTELLSFLNESQRAAIALQRAWCRLNPDDCSTEIESWWASVAKLDPDTMTANQRTAVECYAVANRCQDTAEDALRGWIVRHNKGSYWAATSIARRERLSGGAIEQRDPSKGLEVPREQLLPFFLAARSAIRPDRDLLGEALSSSYEAFRNTRRDRKAEKDEQEEAPPDVVDLSNSSWYLAAFDDAIEKSSASTHPKVSATVRKVVDLWEAGEKVLVFAFYVQTCRALRVHISNEIERRLSLTARRRLGTGAEGFRDEEVERILERIQDRFFDRTDSPGRRAVDAALHQIAEERATSLSEAQLTHKQREDLIDIMRRFLRVTSTLARCFPLEHWETIDPFDAIASTLDYSDGSGMTWRQKLHGFIDFLTDDCSTDEREKYLEAARQTQTGGIRVQAADDEDSKAGIVTLANVQVATGSTNRDTRARLMRAFNTPFFPDILVCSEVMSEGVDLQRACRHAIHHDLAWNPSVIEQRTGRIDRLGCKAEGKRSIMIYLPYLAGAADERQFRVMSEREQWFRVVMGQDEVAKLITSESSAAIPLPDSIAQELSFKLGIGSAVS